MLDLLQELDRDPSARKILVEIRALPRRPTATSSGAGSRGGAGIGAGAAELDQVFREQGAADFPAGVVAALRALGTQTRPPI